MKKFSLDDIFKNTKTKHELKLFQQSKIKWLEKKIFDKSGKPYIKCLATDKDRPAKPEEIVRQLWIKKLLDDYHYPKDRIDAGRAVKTGSGYSDKETDIVITDPDDKDIPYIIFETKKPKRKDGLKQLKSYCRWELSPIGVWSNGGSMLVLHRQEQNFHYISSIPRADQSLENVIHEQWTIDKLTKENKLVIERTSLKDILLELDDLVWASAKGIDDSFDEAFKLIYAKLYDEWSALFNPDRKRELHFRNYGETDDKLYKKINDLFTDAKQKWAGVFSRDDKIKLKPALVKTCVTALENVRFFSADLQIIDDAFEYLITDVAKGKKGQYFTPRWIIKMCVKMLNPKITEYFLDPACGSSGFGVHTISHFIPKNHTGTSLPPHVKEFAEKNLYNADSSPRAVKVSKALNIIIGDGLSHVYELDSLNSLEWEDDGKSGFKRFVIEKDDDDDWNEENQKTYKFLNFDFIMTNPPFAGPISDEKILNQYQLAKKNGKTVKKIDRDILFVERCLNSLTPGGRMAIVLPQGLLNNAHDFFIREYLFDKAKILAVVGLHGNTFKPHTGTKTSVVFLQKYTDKELEEIQKILNKHEKKWKGFHKTLNELNKKNTITEDKISPIVQIFLDSNFSELNDDEENQNDDDTQDDEETEEILKERLEELELRLEGMKKSEKGKTQLIRTIENVQLKIASKSLKGQLQWLLSHETLLKSLHDVWIKDVSAKDLDYKIFFAVSEKSGKESNGNLIYLQDSDGSLILENGHPVVDNDCDEIADEFIKFAKKEKLKFWS